MAAEGADRPRVTVVVPVRDEAARIAGCIEAVAASDFPHELTEVLVVDGGSTDGTDVLASQVLAGRGWWRAETLRSSAGDRSSNLNVGLAAASAPILVRVDARSRIRTSYISHCVALLESRPELAVVGGRQRAVAAAPTETAAGVARALNNRWGMGLARYRRAKTSGPTDTVYLGAFRTLQLRRAGGWRSALAVGEDFDLNRRLHRDGAVWFDAELAVDYLPRTSLRAIARQYWGFGRGKAAYWRLSGDRPRPRQAVLLAAPVVALAGFGAVAAVAGLAVAGACAASSLALGAVLEVAGADGPHCGWRGHLVALTTLALVGLSWWGGVVSEMVRPGSESSGTGTRAGAPAATGDSADRRAA